MKYRTWASIFQIMLVICLMLRSDWYVNALLFSQVIFCFLASIIESMPKVHHEP